MIIRFLYIVLILFMSIDILAQSGSSLKDFEKKLSDYYDQELIADVIAEIGKDDQAKVWSWDIGEYSLDNNNDVACVVRYPKEQSKICSVYFFIDINGTLTPVHKQSRIFVESPLEVGVAIKNGSCHVTSKNEQFHWDITGYQYRHGVFFEYDHFSTLRNKGQTIEQYRNVIDRRNSMHVFSTRTEETAYYHHYHDIPAYHVKTSIPFGLHHPIVIDAPDDVIKGAFYWKGPQDASIMIEQSRYSDAMWNLELKVLDDSICTSLCDTCVQDKIMIHLSRSPKLGNTIDTQEVNKDSILTVELNPNMETPHTSSMNIIGSSTKLPIDVHRESNGYRIVANIPTKFMTFKDSESSQSDIQTIGCTIELLDIDNPFRPEEQTRIVSSAYEQGNSSSLGTVTFYPMNTFDGEFHSHFSHQFVQTLQQLGF